MRAQSDKTDRERERERERDKEAGPFFSFVDLSSASVWRPPPFFRSPHTHAVPQLLSRKGNGVPLVVDLSNFVPDGSPHYTPPSSSFLSSLLISMKRHSLLPIAVTSSAGPLPKSIEMISAEIGLPTIMRSAASRASADSPQSTTVEDIFRVVSMRSEGDVPSGVECEPAEADLRNRASAATDEVFEVENHPPTSQVSSIASDGDGDRDGCDGYAQESNLENASLGSSMDTEEPSPPPTPPPPAAASPSTRIYEGHVRSGQQVSSPSNGNLVVLGNVSSGGELVSDGDIHVYGRLRGRALAGLGKGSKGRIYATSFDPELICVGDIFTTIEANENGDMLFKPGASTMAYVNEKSGELNFSDL